MPAYQHFLPGLCWAGKEWLGLLSDLYQPFPSGWQGDFDEKSTTIRVVDELPHSATGKVAKGRLRDVYGDTGYGT